MLGLKLNHVSKRGHWRLGGMHTLISFGGDIGSLKIDSGVFILRSDVFGGVKSVEIPQNVLALQVVAGEAVRNLVEILLVSPCARGNDA